ncbi:MAG TPA: hypothetical protein VN554_01405 [Verrucomicrobiae bacterium]|nr:hypothetical protein [Verrucomicrobiae bacterium]
MPIHEIYRPDVAKYGGTAAAHPEIIFQQDSHPDNQVRIMVISAPGREADFPEKLTTALLNGGGLPAAQERFAHIARRLFGPKGEALVGPEIVLADMPQDYERWQTEGHALEALGEYWSARMYAAYSGREFVDAAEVVRLDREGKVDLASSVEAIQGRFQPRRQYIVPGFYGSDPDGRIRTLGRNSSDTTGALIARALHSPHYYNFSDQDGWHSGPPDTVENSTVRDRITYREGHELVLGGYAVLAAESFVYLRGSGVETVICNAFGRPGNRGTRLSDDRDWQDSPLAAVTGRLELVSMALTNPLLNEQVGGTEAVFEYMQALGVPYESITTATEDITWFAAGDHQAALEAIADSQGHVGLNRTAIRPEGSVHIVGEGLADRNPLSYDVIGRVGHVFLEAGIEDHGIARNGDSPSLTMFVDPETLSAQADPNAFRLAHDALAELLQNN